MTKIEHNRSNACINGTMSFLFKFRNGFWNGFQNVRAYKQTNKSFRQFSARNEVTFFLEEIWIGNVRPILFKRKIIKIRFIAPQLSLNKFHFQCIFLCLIFLVQRRKSDLRNFNLYFKINTFYTGFHRYSRRFRSW